LRFVNYGIALISPSKIDYCKYDKYLYKIYNMTNIVTVIN